MAGRKKSSPVRNRVESSGVRQRLGRPVKDATEGLAMPLTAVDLKKAQTRRSDYDINESANFGECVLATCVSKVAGAEVLVMRTHAFLALPGDEHTLRYKLTPRSQMFVHLNDEHRFDEIPPNVVIELAPPPPMERLVAKRASWRRNPTSGSGEKRPDRSEPYRGIWRDGRFQTDADA